MPAVCREGDTLNTGHECDAVSTLDVPGPVSYTHLTLPTSDLV